MRILFNGHGGRVGGPPADPGQFVVPAGVSIHFYIADGGILGNDVAWRVLQWRQNGGVGAAPVAPITFGPGAMCQDYYGLPYPALGVVDGVWLESVSRAAAIFVQVLRALDSQRWGAPTAHTVNVFRRTLPAVGGGAAYARDVISLSDLANCPTVTDVDWISCREIW